MGSAFHVRFLPADRRVAVAAPGVRQGPVGEAGSLLDIALGAGIAVDHSCGGIAGCATCHCRVLEGGPSIPPPAADELAQLAHAVGRTPKSRLACQAVPDGGADLVVEIPPLE